MMFHNRISRFNCFSSLRRTYRLSAQVCNYQSHNSRTTAGCICNNEGKLVKSSSFIANNKFTKVGSYLMFSSESLTEEIDAVTYESVCEETLDSLCEFFEDIVERSPSLKSADVSFGDGVLTVNLDRFGTYVINRQSPNKQIWLSSPTSGPKRYDFVPSRDGWVYRHDNNTLHNLLREELSAILKSQVDFSSCAHCGNLK